MVNIKRHYLLLLVLTLCTSNLLKGQFRDTLYSYYKGKIGASYSITLELLRVADKLQARYFYDKYRSPIELEVELRDTFLYLKENNLLSAEHNYFVLREDSEKKAFNGYWKNAATGRKMEVNLQKLNVPDLKNGSTFDRMLDFQSFLNYFDLVPVLPFRVDDIVFNKKIRWQLYDKKALNTDYKKMLPYKLARRYIMDKVTMPTEGSINYFDIASAQYNVLGFYYKALCTVFKTSNYVNVLVEFENDSGWDKQHLVCWLSYDYTGNLVGQCKAYKALDVEVNQIHSIEKSAGFFLSDSTLLVDTKKTVRGVSYDESGHELYKHQDIAKQLSYKLDINGKINQIKSLKNKISDKKIKYKLE